MFYFCFWSYASVCLVLWSFVYSYFCQWLELYFPNSLLLSSFLLCHVIFLISYFQFDLSLSCSVFNFAPLVSLPWFSLDVFSSSCVSAPTGPQCVCVCLKPLIAFYCWLFSTFVFSGVSWLKFMTLSVLDFSAKPE